MSNAIHVQGQNTTTESSPHEEIKAFLKNYSAAWNSQDFWRLKDLWDLDDPMPFYKAMEVERPVIGWNNLSLYFDPKPGAKFLDGILTKYTNISIKLIAPDVALAFFDLEWDLKAKGPSKPMGGTDPTMVVLKKKPEGWRMSAYVEACMSPGNYVRKLLEGQTRPHFYEYLKENTGYEPDAPHKNAAEKYWSVKP